MITDTSNSTNENITAPPKRTALEFLRNSQPDENFSRSLAKNKKSNDLTKRLFQLQNSAAKLLPSQRVATVCMKAIQPEKNSVTIESNGESLRYGNLAVCDSVWSCPICARKIARQRTLEIGRALRHAKHEASLITLTMSHHKGESLQTCLDRMKHAYNRWTGNRKTKEARASTNVVGFIRALEVTYGEKHGWHVHYHMLAMTSGKWTRAKLQAARDDFGASWFDAVALAGGVINEHGFDMKPPPRGDTARDDYLAKMNASAEVSRQVSKESRKGGRTPMQLLADYTDDDDRQSGALFVEYALCLKGSRHIRFSPGLKKLLDIDAITQQIEAEKVEALDEYRVIYEIPVTTWWKIVRSGERARCMWIARNLEARHFEAYLSDFSEDTS